MGVIQTDSGTLGSFKVLVTVTVVHTVPVVHQVSKMLVKCPVFCLLEVSVIARLLHHTPRRIDEETITENTISPTLSFAEILRGFLSAAKAP